MTDTTAKIRAKGLENTGIDETLAGQLYNKIGSYIVAVVELKVEDKHGPSAEGKRAVDLTIASIEPCTDEATENRLREVMRALNRQRRTDQGEMLPGTEGDSVETAVDAATAVIERDEDGNVVGIWNGDPNTATAEKTLDGPPKTKRKRGAATKPPKEEAGAEPDPTNPEDPSAPAAPPPPADPGATEGWDEVETDGEQEPVEIEDEPEEDAGRPSGSNVIGFSHR